MMSEINSTQSATQLSFERYLGLDVRPRSLGFVVIENGVVLDCGIRMCDRSQFDDCLGQGFDRILKIYIPCAVIVRGVRGLVGDPRKRKVATAIRRRAKQHDIDVFSISTATIRSYFGRYGATTKYQIAQSVAMLLPELAWKLPRNRKPWESEHYRMSIFDAAAVIIAHMGFAGPAFNKPRSPK